MKTSIHSSPKLLGTPCVVLTDRRAQFVDGETVTTLRTGVAVPNGNRILFKLEHLVGSSPTGSFYDRLYPHLFRQAMAQARVEPEETHVVECSVGNAAAAFANTARRLGFRRYTVILPEDIYPARIAQANSLGAKILFSPPKIGPRGYIAALEDLLRSERSIAMHNASGSLRICPISKVGHMPIAPYGEFVDEARVALGLLGYEDEIHFFVSPVGSGNTISMTGRYLKSLSEVATVLAVEHEESPFVSLFHRGEEPSMDTVWSEPDYPATAIHGVPLNKLNLDLRMIDDVILLPRNTRESGLRLLNESLGLRAGRPSGMLMAAALRVCEKVEHKTILSLIFDSDSKYADVWCPPLTIEELANHLKAGSGAALEKEGRSRPSGASRPQSTFLGAYPMEALGAEMRG